MAQQTISCNHIKMLSIGAVRSGCVIICGAPVAADSSMKMKFERTILASRKLVWETFDNPENLSRWQPALVSFTHISGVPGQPGAVSELVYNEKGRKIVTTETVTERQQPHFIAGIYDNDWVSMLTVNHFEAIDDNTTRFASYSNMAFKGIMKIMSLFVTNSIRSRIEGDLNRFKFLVETEAEDSAR